MIKRQQVDTFEERNYCNYCDTELTCTHSLPVHPVKYAYYCPTCHKHSSNPYHYPRIVHIPKDESRKSHVEWVAEMPLLRYFKPADLSTAVMNPCKKNETIVHFLEMSEPFGIDFGGSTLVEGSAGDYILRDAQGTLSIVSKDIFQKLYTVLRG